MSLCPGPCLLHQGLRLLCCTEFGASLLTVVVAASVFALMSAENSDALLLESIYSIFSSKKFGLGTARYYDTLFGPRFFMTPSMFLLRSHHHLA
ncbi:hypothetical protein ARMSODRAFT_808740 [Armillaria solidipes]|uniref:Uncharacterized protein n=1 Tax=Armillaria solidipes TaxID=1076256 RepID=A0A2H3B7T7_9AGAR|nr:hypothetical protein ARMSODRAFT_808740 [Armillaria solidipes]